MLDAWATDTVDSIEMQAAVVGLRMWLKKKGVPEVWGGKSGQRKLVEGERRRLMRIRRANVAQRAGIAEVVK